MWSIILILVIGGGMVFIEVPFLLKKKQKRDLWIFSLLLFVGVVLNILHNLDITFPKPAEVITSIFEPLNHVISELFH